MIQGGHVLFVRVPCPSLVPDTSQKRGLESLDRAFDGHSADFVPCRTGTHTDRTGREKRLGSNPPEAKRRFSELRFWEVS